MCGIAGFTLPHGLAAERRRAQFGARLQAMVASLAHRGPDAQTALLLDGAALGHTRLAIVDLEGGRQPMRDPQTGVTLVFNGEVFNHVELRAALAERYPFRTRSDTEVILAAYLAKGIQCVQDFVGQFAFALYDPRSQALWLARDRVGICPLVYAETPEGLAFASEAKALFAAEWVRPELDPRGLKQTLQLWAPVPPRTSFAGVQALPPASVARYGGGRLSVWRYWDLDLGQPPGPLDEDEAAVRLGDHLEQAISIRLRADVPVGAYLSGGLDSSVVCAVANHQLGGTLSTFSVEFESAAFDERAHQRAVAEALRTDHHAARLGDREIGELLPEAVAHGEQVLLRAAPAPFLRLSALVREHHTKVVLTGEGADEVFLGYDLFKETRVRQFWARQPESAWRPALLRRLYPYLPLASQGTEVLGQFFGAGLDQPGSPAFSHLLRWTAGARLLRFLAPGFAEQVADEDPVASLLEALPGRIRLWRPLARAQYLEMHTLLSGYLLSAQGDRMLMAHGVEGRFPFLDHRLIEFAATLPENMKLRVLEEKYLLKRYAERWVPKAVLARPKYPYRAPVAGALAGPHAPAWARELLSAEGVRALGIFDADKVRRLVAKLGQPGPASESDAMALTAVATAQLLAHRFAQPSAVRGEAVGLEVA